MEAVVPFDILADRRKRTSYLNNLQKSIDACIQPKVMQEARNALAALVVCEEALEQELIISVSYVCFYLPYLYFICACIVLLISVHYASPPSLQLCSRDGSNFVQQTKEFIQYIQQGKNGLISWLALY